MAIAIGLGILNIVIATPADTDSENDAGPTIVRLRSIQTPASISPAAALFTPRTKSRTHRLFLICSQNGSTPSTMMIPGMNKPTPALNAPAQDAMAAPRKGARLNIGPGTHPNSAKPARNTSLGKKPFSTISLQVHSRSKRAQLADAHHASA